MKEIIDKIEKLLRLAGSSNEHEAALAMAKAMELADRHAIDLHKIGCKSGEVRFVTESIRLRKRVMLEVSIAAALCAEFFHCEVLITRNWKRARNVDYWFDMQFIGSPEHVVVARHIHTYLVRCSRDSLARTGATERGFFTHGFFSAIKAKLRAERDAMNDGSFALVVADQKSAREDFMEAMFGRIPTKLISTRSLVTKSAGSAMASLKAGYHEGLNTQLRTAIGREQEEFVLA